MEEHALGEMGLSPKRFYRLSYRQFTLMVNYHKTKNRQRLERTAWVVSTLMNNHKNWKSPVITVDRLLGKEDDEYTELVRQTMLENDDWMQDGFQPEWVETD